jgi:transcriptional regulator with XRE-family HTH domain
MGFSRPQPRFLGKKLRQIRKRLDLTRGVMAEIVGHKRSPVYSRPHIAKFERGRREPSLLVPLQYARVAKVSVDVLIDDKIDLR